MSTSTMPRPADVAARASAAILSLTDEQLVAVMHSSRTIQKRVLPNCWETVKTAAPDLAAALDELHTREATQDRDRFEALAAAHHKQLSDAVKGRAGKTTAGLVITAVVLGLATAGLGLAGVIGTALIVAGSTLAACLFIAGFISGNRLAQRTGNWLFADPEAAASIVWDAGIDAAAANALKDRTGQDGLTPDILRALSSIWTGAGLETAQFTPPPKPATAPGMNPFVLMAAHQIFAGTVVQSARGEMFRFNCRCGQHWDSPVDAEDELAGPAAHIREITEDAAAIARSVLDRAHTTDYPLSAELRGLLEDLAAEAAPALR